MKLRPDVVLALPLAGEGFAMRVSMPAKRGVQVNDRWIFAQPHAANIQEPANPHFDAKGSQALAKEIARQIKGVMK